MKSDGSVSDDSFDRCSVSKQKKNFDFKCAFKYDDLNQSYKTRTPEFSHITVLLYFQKQRKETQMKLNKLSRKVSESDAEDTKPCFDSYDDSEKTTRFLRKKM